MQLGQQVAVSQGHLVPVQEHAVGDLDVLDTVVVDLVGQRRAEILIQLLQRLQEAAFQSCKETRERLLRRHMLANHMGAAFHQETSPRGHVYIMNSHRHLQ